VFIAFVTFAQANVVAKRIRSIGLPGWWVILIAIIVNVFVLYFFAEKVASLLQGCFYLAVLLLPEKTIK